MVYKQLSPRDMEALIKTETRSVIETLDKKFLVALEDMPLAIELIEEAKFNIISTSVEGYVYESTANTYMIVGIVVEDLQKFCRHVNTPEYDTASMVVALLDRLSYRSPDVTGHRTPQYYEISIKAKDVLDDLVKAKGTVVYH
jgi:hypothetical protein